MKNISIIVLKTDEKKYAECFRGIINQTIYEQIEIVCIDNTSGKFKSAASGLNYGASIAKGDIFIFMHQDVYLDDIDAIKKYYYFLQHNEKCIIGPAGVKEHGRPITDMFETRNNIKRGIGANGEIMPVYSLDECLLAMKKKLWEQLKFDEQVCDNWHCYGLDICYQNILKGGENMLYPLTICHDSLGNSLNKDFTRSIKKMIDKYKKYPEIKRIKGTCVDINCNYFSYFVFLFKQFLKENLKIYK